MYQMLAWVSKLLRSSGGKESGAGSASGAVYAALVSASPDYQGDGMGCSNQATDDAHMMLTSHLPWPTYRDTACNGKHQR